MLERPVQLKSYWFELFKDCDIKMQVLAISSVDQKEYFKFISRLNLGKKVFMGILFSFETTSWRKNRSDVRPHPWEPVTTTRGSSVTPEGRGIVPAGLHVASIAISCHSCHRGPREWYNLVPVDLHYKLHILLLFT